MKFIIIAATIIAACVATAANAQEDPPPPPPIGDPGPPPVAVDPTGAPRHGLRSIGTCGTITFGDVALMFVGLALSGAAIKGTFVKRQKATCTRVENLKRVGVTERDLLRTCKQEDRELRKQGLRKLEFCAVCKE